MSIYYESLYANAGIFYFDAYVKPSSSILVMRFFHTIFKKSNFISNGHHTCIGMVVNVFNSLKKIEKYEKDNFSHGANGKWRCGYGSG
jgi:hypothetical protein